MCVCAMQNSLARPFQFHRSKSITASNTRIPNRRFRFLQRRGKSFSRENEHLYIVSEFRSRYDRAEFAVGATRVRQSSSGCNNSSLRPWGGEREDEASSRREEKVTRISFRTINETRAKGISSYKSVLRNVVALQRVASVSSIELGRR